MTIFRDRILQSQCRCISLCKAELICNMNGFQKLSRSLHVRETMRFVGTISVMEVELIGILEALLWAKESVVGAVLVESDSMLSVHAIQQGQETRESAGGW